MASPATTEALPKAPAAQRQTSLVVEVVKQFPGQQQVDRRVKVQVPGKFFPTLQPSEQAQFYEGEAVEFKHRHTFQRHLKAWGAGHTGPGIRLRATSGSTSNPIINPSDRRGGGGDCGG